jgi:hypothetical protein
MDIIKQKKIGRLSQKKGVKEHWKDSSRSKFEVISASLSKIFSAPKETIRKTIALNEKKYKVLRKDFLFFGIFPINFTAWNTFFVM